MNSKWLGRLPALSGAIFAVVAVGTGTQSLLAASAALLVAGAVLMLGRHPVTDAGGVIINDEALAGGQEADVEAGLGDVDTDKGGVHAVPSLRKRASLAAQATVRVQWNDGRGALLSHGLAVPQGNRSPARHRIGNPTR